VRRINTISFIGSGNVATALAIKLFNKKYTIRQVYSLNLNNAKRLAKQVNAKAINNTENLLPADIYIMALKDDAIEIISKKIKNKLVPIVHTSGTVNSNVFLKNKFKVYGCLYPLQTFSKKNIQKIKSYPILLETSNPNFYKALEKLTKSISKNILPAKSEERLNIHLAAVFACNFTNYLYSISEEILNKNNHPLDLLYPLIKQTAENSKNKKIFTYQTGPAIRGDNKTIEKHLNILKEQKEFSKLYQLLTKSIQKKAKE
jgi:predicted short-subunit dehydrogenase-like oxidoreductase (DUF2520 family)